MASAADILPRVEKLIAGEDVDELENRQPVQTNSATSQLVTLDNDWDTAVFIIEEPVNTTVNLELDGNNDYALLVTDVYGYEVLYVDDTYTGKESGEFKIEIEAPYYLTVFQNETISTFASLESNVSLTPYRDRDGAQKLTIGQRVKANIDYPGDFDTYRITLSKGDIFNVRVESVMIDPYLSIDIEGMSYSYEELIYDDDTGGGIFGLDAELSYEAPQTGTYFISIDSSYDPYFGGYILTVDEPYEGAPTPSAPLPTPTPITSEFGGMALYTSTGDPTFTVQYPAEWSENNVPREFAAICDYTTACLGDEFGYVVLAIAIEKMSDFGILSMSREEYIKLYLSSISEQVPGFRLILQEERSNSQELSYDVIHFSGQDDSFEIKRLIYFDEASGTAFNVSYIFSGSSEIPEDEDLANFLERLREETDRFVDYSFSTFEVHN